MVHTDSPFVHLGDALVTMHGDQEARLLAHRHNVVVLVREVLKLRSYVDRLKNGHVVTIRDGGSGLPGAPAIYSPTTGVVLGGAVADVSNAFYWGADDVPFQINLELNDAVASDSGTPAAAGTFEYWNGNRDGQDLSAGNWIDPQYYVLKVDHYATEMAVSSYIGNGGNGSTVMEPDIQWTITGWGQTVLRGSLDVTSVPGTTRLVVKTSSNGLPEYRPFDASLNVNPQEAFASANTELVAYSYTGVLGASTVLSAELLDTRYVLAQPVAYPSQ